MRKVMLLLLIFFASAFFTLQGEEYDFRQTRWGMSVKEVRSSERSSLLRKEGGKKEYRLTYSASIADMEGRIVYLFSEYNLRKAWYSFPIEESGQAVEKYWYLKKILTEKYGPPEHSKRTYSEGKKKEFGPFSFLLMLPLNLRLGGSLEKGQLVLETVWATDFTYITLLAEKKEERYSVSVRYEHKRYADDRSRDEEEKRALEEKELLDAL
jgi:hypothetical protein